MEWDWRRYRIVNFQKNVIDFDKDKYDKSEYSLFGGSISFNGSTLNARQFSTQGSHEELVAQIFTGKERFYPGETSDTKKTSEERHSWLQLSYMKGEVSQNGRALDAWVVSESIVFFKKFLRELYGYYDAGRRVCAYSAWAIDV